MTPQKGVCKYCGRTRTAKHLEARAAFGVVVYRCSARASCKVRTAKIRRAAKEAE